MKEGSQLACFLALKAAVSRYVGVEYRQKLYRIIASVL